MSKMQKIIILVLAWFVLFEFNGTGGGINRPKVVIDHLAMDFDAMSYAGLFHMMGTVGADEIDKPDDEVVECNCGGKGKVSYDGGTSWTDCPCKLNGTCKCKSQTSKVILENVNDEAKILKRLYKTYYVIKATASWCGPCAVWENGPKKEFEKVGITVESMDIDSNKQFAKNADINRIPTFFIGTKVDKLYHSHPDGGFYSYTGPDFSVENATEIMLALDKALHPNANDGVFYERVQSAQTKLNGKLWASRQEYISHLKSDSNHIEVRNWPLENLSQYELKAIHDDSHAGKLGVLNGL